VPSSPVTTAQHNVLLIEEYDALSVAIQSALKKFAPHHRFHAVRSLPEARRAALEQKPELIILDFDPPHPGAITFFGEMRGVLPETRVLVIAAGITPDLIAERGANGALQFLEKPFELVEFGAAVQALLGPWMETGMSRGTLRDLALDDVAVLALSTLRNVVIEIRAEEGRTGELHVRNSQITHARSTEAEGKRALVEMLTWRDPQFIENIASESAPRTIHDPWAATLIEALREAKKPKHARPAPAEPNAPAKPPVAATKTGPKILIIDDTEMLLIFVEDSIALADPTLQMTTALTGLQGVKEAARIIPDLVLVDYVLPDIKGDEVCRRIGRNDSTAHVPIVMMSGHVHEMAAVASKLPNVVATIAKPFISDALVALVQQALKKGPLREKPKFPSEKEISRAKSAEFAVSKTPILSEPAKKPVPTASKRDAPPLPVRRTELGPLEGGALATPAVTTGSQASGSVEPTARRELAPPLPTTPPPLPIARTTPRQKLEPVAPRLAPNEVLLDLPLDVVAMQVNAAFQIGAIRARPASLTVAIEIPALNTNAASPLKTGFHLGPIDLDATGCISIVRLIPTSQPFRPVETRGAFEIGGVTVVPANERERLQLISTAASNTTMQLFAPLELISVELDHNLEIRQLVLRWRDKAVRVSLNSQSSQAQTGANFETTSVRLDQSRRIDELTLTPIS
jgi:DNA-binding response OmpR family regulator